MNIQAHDVDTMKIHLSHYPSGICRAGNDDYMIVFPNLVGQASSAFWVFRYEKEEYKPRTFRSVLRVVEDEQEVRKVVESLEAQIAKKTEESIKKAGRQKEIKQFIDGANQMIKGYSPAIPDSSESRDDGCDASFSSGEGLYFFRERMNPEEWEGWQLWRVSKLWSDEPVSITLVAVHLGSQIICWKAPDGRKEEQTS